MSYGFDLCRLPEGADPDEAYERLLEKRERELESVPAGAGNLTPVDGVKEERKSRLAAALRARYPSFEIAVPDFSVLARDRSISGTEARVRFRDLELHEKRLSIQIRLFDDGAGASLSPTGEKRLCAEALRVLWDCLQILESDAGYSTHDPQMNKVLNLNSDFGAVLQFACGAKGNEHRA